MCSGLAIFARTETWRTNSGLKRGTNTPTFTPAVVKGNAVLYAVGGTSPEMWYKVSSCAAYLNLKLLNTYKTSCRFDKRTISGKVIQCPPGLEVFTSANCPDRLWGPPSLLFRGYRGLFSRGQRDMGAKLITPYHPVWRLRMHESISPFPHMPIWLGA